MQRFLIIRLGRLLLTLLFVSLITFVMLRLMPGDPATVLAGQDATPEVIHDLREKFGLDKPIIVQFGLFVEKAATGDLGQSIRSRAPVVDEIASRLPNTLALAALAVAVAFAIGILLGVVAAVREGRWQDVTILVTALIGTSAPSFWVGLVLVLVFSVQLGLFPVSGNESLISIVLPAASLLPPSVAVIARLTRSTMLDVLGEDYIRTALSKGATRASVLWRHALRNALIPVVTMAGLEFARMLGGVIAVETIFAWPGVGKALVDAITSRDYPMVQGIVLAFAVIFALTNLVVDLVNGLIDPRVRTH
jgi:peptide/nickel transport system permease protein/oligopeptide transport system permease protein